MNSAHQIRTTGQKIIKIHQLEQILGKCPYAGSMCPPPFPKIYFFQKVRMRFATFLYYPKRHDVIKFKVLCH